MGSNPFIIGLVGLPGAGKTTVTEFLEYNGFERVILSDIIREELNKRGIDKPSRELLQDVGNELRRTYGPDILARRAMKRLRTKGGSKFVIDGIRNTAEIAYLTKQKRFFLLGITASQRVRYQRLKNRPVNPLTSSFASFLREERREQTLGGKTTGLRVIDCLTICPYHITNSSTVAVLERKIQTFLHKHI